jgi:hypothetical protein
MGDFHEQHVCVKLCSRLGNMFSDTFEILKQAFGVEAMSRTQTHEWYKCFKGGRTLYCQDDLQHKKMKKT